MTPSWRKPAGMLLIVAIIILWAALVASLSAVVGQWHWGLQLVFYIVAGIAWITPMKPLLRWMEGGRG
ncbi:DUF2842 domain-containing protein [uncultured Sphingomonas sp.]|uniref:DUF2842 domain-containing protein n=1 Tax=uncultured Sphingomonas sp. TaxID=158754 RepID=UPI0025FF65AA|nr:DUF2842 domain-containing protein [uncultured Sphingomonas sp.]